MAFVYLLVACLAAAVAVFALEARVKGLEAAAAQRDKTPVTPPRAVP